MYYELGTFGGNKDSYNPGFYDDIVGYSEVIISGNQTMITYKDNHDFYHFNHTIYK